MSLTQAVERGITSATYNPEAEKALQEERKKASEARQAFRARLFQIRDVKTGLVQKKQATAFYIQTVDTLADNGFKWITDNPTANFQQILDKQTATNEVFQDVSKANVVLLSLELLPSFLRTVGSDALLKKKIKEDKKKEIDAYASSLDAWLKTSSKLTTDEIYSKEQEVQLQSKGLLEGTGESIPAVTNVESAGQAQKQLAAKEVEVKKEEEADKQTFKLSRLLKETYSVATKVIGSLFIVMLILVSGMLTANDAIGRDPQYRILYFIYGGLGFPIMLIYYLYRWFFGTAPHIYRLLPLYTKQADTSIARFFLFPFTYEEDKAAIDAKTKFMTEAATLVGKEYKSAADQLGENLERLVKGVESLSLNVADTMKKGPNAILKGLQGLQVVNESKP